MRYLLEARADVNATTGTRTIYRENRQEYVQHSAQCCGSGKFKYLIQIYGFWALGNMILVVHPGSGSWLFTHPVSRIPDPGVNKAPDPESATLILVAREALLNAMALPVVQLLWIAYISRLLLKGSLCPWWLVPAVPAANEGGGAGQHPLNRISWTKQQCGGSGMFITPNFSYPGSEFFKSWIPDQHQWIWVF